ncbi:unnamed protein product [Rhizopus stolonifer]
MFQGKAIICFYSNGILQGHCIELVDNSSPYSMSGQLLPDYIDPNHNDCMELESFYKILIRHNDKKEKDLFLLLRRPMNNDAGGLSTHEHEEETNEKHFLSFETEQFYSGSQASRLKQKYFNMESSTTTTEDTDLVCFGEMKFGKFEQ